MTANVIFLIFDKNTCKMHLVLLLPVKKKLCIRMHIVYPFISAVMACTCYCILVCPKSVIRATPKHNIAKANI